MLQQGCVRSLWGLLLHVGRMLHVSAHFLSCLNTRPACGLRLPVHIKPLLSLAWQQVLNLSGCMGLVHGCTLQCIAVRGLA